MERSRHPQVRGFGHDVILTEDLPYALLATLSLAESALCLFTAP